MRLYSDSFFYHSTLHQSDPDLPYLLMLHGFMGSERVFDPLIEDLSSFCNPITIDLAGHGQTESPTDPAFYTAERQVKQIKSVIQRFQLKGLYLYGYSMGGRLAFQLLSSHPELFSGAVIESSHCGINSDPQRVQRKGIDELRAKEIEENYEHFITHWSDLPLFRHTPDTMKERYLQIMKLQNPETISASLRGFGAGMMPSVCDQLSDLTLPLTLVAGDRDQKYRDKMTEIAGIITSSSLEIVSNAGHRVHADQPKRWINIIRKRMDQT